MRRKGKRRKNSRTLHLTDWHQWAVLLTDFGGVFVCKQCGVRCDGPGEDSAAVTGR